MEPKIRTASGMSNSLLSGTAMNKSIRYDHPSMMAVYLKSLAYLPMIIRLKIDGAKNRASLGKFEMKGEFRWW